MDSAQNNYFTFENARVFFKHTDYYGNVHPYNYFEWTSYVREAFFQETVQNFCEVLSRNIKMMTTKISSEMIEDSHFGDKFQARLSVDKVKKVSFDMIVKFYNTRINKVACKTVHTVVFVNELTSRFAAIPDEMQRVIARYRESEKGVYDRS